MRKHLLVRRSSRGTQRNGRRRSDRSGATEKPTRNQRAEPSRGPTTNLACRSRVTGRPPPNDRSPHARTGTKPTRLPLEVERPGTNENEHWLETWLAHRWPTPPSAALAKSSAFCLDVPPLLFGRRSRAINVRPASASASTEDRVRETELFLFYFFISAKLDMINLQY